MFYCLKEPKHQLEEIIQKLERTHTDCHPYDYTECDYIYSQVNEKEAFVQALKEAIKHIEIANEFTVKYKKGK